MTTYDRPNYSTATRLLHCPRLKGDRTVRLGADTYRRNRSAQTEFVVLGPPAGLGHLTVHVRGGMLPLHVLGGRVTVILESYWGNVLTGPALPADAADLRVIVGQGCKATLIDVPPAQVTGDLSRTHNHTLALHQS